jgi:hypothetical protein
MSIPGYIWDSNSGTNNFYKSWNRNIYFKHSKDVVWCQGKLKSVYFSLLYTWCKLKISMTRWAGSYIVGNSFRTCLIDQ